MADGYLNFDTRINMKGFDSGIKNIKASFDSLIAAANRVTQSFSRVTEAYRTQIEAEARLAATMHNSTAASEKEIQSVKNLAGSLQELGVVGDEVQLAGAQELATYVENVESIKSMLPVLDDMIAQQYGYSASTDSAVTIATMLGKVLQGQTSALSRYGYSFDEAQEKLLKFGTEEQRVATLAAVVEESVSGVNAALANTPTGKVKQLENDFGDLKETSGKLLTEVLSPIVVKLDVIVKKLNEAFTAASAGIKGIFGVTGDVAVGGAAASSEELDDSSDSAADNFADIAESAKEAEKANEGSVAAFDELNLLNKEESVIDTDSVEEELEELSDSFENDSFELPVTVDSKAFESSVDTVIDSVKAKWERLKDLSKPLKSSFDELRGTLGSVAGYSFENLLNFYEHFLKPLGEWTLGTGLPKFVDIIDKTLKNIDFDRINTALDDLYKATEPFAEHIGEGLLWFFEEILSPLAEWTVGEAFPAFIDVISSFLTLADKVGKVVLDTLKTMWNEFFKKASSFTGDAIIGFLSFLSQFFKDVADNPQAVTALVVIAEVIGTIAAAFVLIQGVPKFLAGIPALIAAVTNPLGLAITLLIAISALIVEIITYKDELKEFGKMTIDYYSQKISAFWDNLKSGAKSAWDGIKSTFSKAGAFFGDIFSRAWKKVQEVFSAGGAVFHGIKEGILETFKQIVNSLIDGLNDVVRVPFEGINNALGGIKGISIAGAEPFAWLPTIDIPQIPRLATGTVIPANYGEFAAILGDNKRETEIVSPESAMKQAFMDAMIESGLIGRNNSDDGDFVFQIGSYEIFRILRKEINNYKRTHNGAMPW